MKSIIDAYLMQNQALVHKENKVENIVLVMDEVSVQLKMKVPLKVEVMMVCLTNPKVMLMLCTV